MKTLEWIAIAGGAVIFGFMILSLYKGSTQHKNLPTFSAPTPHQHPTLTGPEDQEVSLEQSIHVNCNCVNNILTGPNCSPNVKGKSCSGLMKAVNADRNCVCDSGGSITGEGCPYIGMSCMEYDNTYNPEPAHVHTTCPKGSVLMGTTCVKEWDNSIHPTTASV